MTDEKIIFGQIGNTIDDNIVTGRLSPDSGG
jgi:DNA-binding transcriptional regulator YhcF (GntR family)